MRKISNFCGIFATVFVTTTIVLLASCSQDDDNYESDMYTMAEMGTRLGGGDPGGGGNGGFNSHYYQDPNNCGGVALAILYGRANTISPEEAYETVRELAGDCTNMTHERVCEVGKQLGLYCNTYTSLTDSTAESQLAMIGVQGKILFIDNGGPIDHAIVGSSMTSKKKVSHGDTIRTLVITGEDRSGIVTYKNPKVNGVIE